MPVTSCGEVWVLLVRCHDGVCLVPVMSPYMILRCD